MVVGLGDDPPLLRKRWRRIGLCVWFLGFLSLLNFDMGSCQQLIESTRYAVGPVNVFSNRVVKSLGAISVIVDNLTKTIAVIEESDL